jgi:hypothetical protein
MGQDAPIEAVRDGSPARTLSAQVARSETWLRGWAARIRTGESTRELSDWICVTTSPVAGASRAAETLRVGVGRTIDLANVWARVAFRPSIREHAALFWLARKYVEGLLSVGGFDARRGEALVFSMEDERILASCTSSHPATHPVIALDGH